MGGGERGEWDGDYVESLGMSVTHFNIYDNLKNLLLFLYIIQCSLYLSEL